MSTKPRNPKGIPSDLEDYEDLMEEVSKKVRPFKSKEDGPPTEREKVSQRTTPQKKMFWFSDLLLLNKISNNKNSETLSLRQGFTVFKQRYVSCRI